MTRRLENTLHGVRTLRAMNADSLQMLIPIIAILATFGFPVALVFVWKWFKLKDRELQLDSELRRSAGNALESRVQRLESIIMALDADLRAKLGTGPAQRTDLLEGQRPELMEGPGARESDQPGGLPESNKIR